MAAAQKSWDAKLQLEAQQLWHCCLPPQIQQGAGKSSHLLNKAEVPFRKKDCINRSNLKPYN